MWLVPTGSRSLHEGPRSTSRASVPEGGASGRCALALLAGLREHGIDVRALAARESWAAEGTPPEEANVEVVDIAPERPGLRPRVLSLTRPLTETRSERARRSGEGRRIRRRRHSPGGDVDHLTRLTAYGSRRCAPALPRAARPCVRRALATRVPPRARARPSGGAGNPRSPVPARELTGRRRRATAAPRPAAHATSSLRRSRLEPARYLPATLDGPPVAGIIGSAAWPPTAQAVRCLVTEVWPRVARPAPDARLAIAGRGTDSLVAGAAGIEAFGPCRRQVSSCAACRYCSSPSGAAAE